VGTADNPKGAIESLSDMVSLGIFEGSGPWGFRCDGALEARERRGKNPSRSEDYGSLDEILKLPNVAWPRVAYKCVYDSVGDRVEISRRCFNLFSRREAC
jgi:hypothetical protein